MLLSLLGLLVVHSALEPTWRCHSDGPQLEVMWSGVRIFATPTGFRLGADKPTAEPAAEGAESPQLALGELWEGAREVAAARFALGTDLMAFCPQQIGSRFGQVAIALVFNRHRGLEFWLTSQDGGSRFRLSVAKALVRAVGYNGAGKTEALHAHPTEANAVTAMLELARARGWPEREALALAAAQNPLPAVRAAAAPELSAAASVQGVAALWLLAHDPVEEVRWAVLEALTLAAGAFEAPESTRRLVMFLHDSNEDIGWHARDVLLGINPLEALRDASSEYKLAALASLMVRAQRRIDAHTAEALRLLADDHDDDVRQQARLVVSLLIP